MIQSIQSYLKAQTLAVNIVKGYQRTYFVQRFDRLFAVRYYGQLANGSRVGLSGLLCLHCKTCLKEGARACICDSVNG